MEREMVLAMSVIHGWLELIQQYRLGGQEDNTSWNNGDHNLHNTPKDERVVLQILQEMARLAQSLRQELRRFLPSIGRLLSEENIKSRSSTANVSLSRLVESCSLPARVSLRLMTESCSDSFRGLQSCRNVPKSFVNGEESRSIVSIPTIQAAQLKVLQESVLTVSLIHELVVDELGQVSPSTLRQSSDYKNNIRHECTLLFLEAIASALPTGPDLWALKRPQPSSSPLSTGLQSSMFVSCMQIMTQALDDLIRRINGPDDPCNMIMSHVVSLLDGAILIRVVDHGTALLASPSGPGDGFPSTASQEQHSAKGKNALSDPIGVPNSGFNSLGGGVSDMIGSRQQSLWWNDPTLILTALNTLQTWLQASWCVISTNHTSQPPEQSTFRTSTTTSQKHTMMFSSGTSIPVEARNQVECWRKVFPTTFGALYQKLVLINRPRVRPDSCALSFHQPQAKSLTRAILAVMTWLLRVTVYPLSIEQNTVPENEESRDQSPRTMNQPCDMENGSGKESISRHASKDALHQLQKLATQSNVNASMETKNVDHDREIHVRFQHHVEETLPRPLQHVIQILMSSPDSVTQGSPTLWTDFLQLLLTLPCWPSTNELVENMHLAALEAWIVLVKRHDHKLPEEQQKTKEHPWLLLRNIVNPSSQSQRLTMAHLFPRRLQLHVEQLIPLSLGHRTEELVQVLDLVKGYLSLITPQSPVQREIRILLLLLGSKTRTTRDTQKGPLSGSIIQTLRHLLEVDFVRWPNFQALRGTCVDLTEKQTGRKSFEASPLSSSWLALDSCLRLQEEDVQDAQPCPWKYLSTERAETAIREMIQALVKHVLEIEGVCQLIDESVADLFHTINPAPPSLYHERQDDEDESDSKFGAEASLSRLSELIASLILMKQLVEAMTSMLSEKMTTKADNKEINQHREHIRKALFAMAKSVLPILTTSPLIDLPICLSSTRTTGGRRRLGTSYFKGLCCFKFHVLDLISTIVGSVSGTHWNDKNDVEMSREVLQGIIYGMVEATVELSCLQVQQKAIYLLRVSLVPSCGFATLSELLQFCSGSLTSTVHSRLRTLPGAGIQRSTLSDSNAMCRHEQVQESSIGSELGTIASVVRVILMDLRTSYDMKRDDNVLKGDWELSNAMSVVTKLKRELFDRMVGFLSVNSLLQVLFLFEDVVLVLSAWLQTHGSMIHTTASKDKEKSTPSWIRSLSRFKKPKTRYPLVELKRETDENIEDHGSPLTESNRSTLESVLKDHTAFVSSLISRSCHLLSHSSLSVQVASCRVSKVSFEYLGLVAHRNSGHTEDDISQETNGTKTAILRHAADSWPAIEARFKASWNKIAQSFKSTVSSLATNPRVPVYAIPEANDDHSESMVLMEKLIDLITVMVLESDDFMASRFRDHVWPIYNSLLNGHVTELSLAAETVEPLVGKLEAHTKPLKVLAPSSRSYSKLRVIRSVIQSLSRIYGSHEIGRASSDLIVIIAKVILPLIQLGNHPDIRDVAMSAVKHMATIDCDAIQFRLLQLSSCSGESSYRQDEGVMATPTVTIPTETGIRECSDSPDVAFQEIRNLIRNLPEQEL